MGLGAVDTVEAEVRELVRRRDLDPVADRSAARSVYDAVAGYGPLQRHLDDPSVEEIWINQPGRVFIAGQGRSELTTTILFEGQVRDLVEKMLKTTGRRIDLSTPCR